MWEGLCEVGDPEYADPALSSCIWGLGRLLQILASSCRPYAGVLSPQYFVGILKAKGTLRPPERQALFGPWELIYGASQ